MAGGCRGDSFGASVFLRLEKIGNRPPVLRLRLIQATLGVLLVNDMQDRLDLVSKKNPGKSRDPGRGDVVSHDLRKRLAN
ncbi:hypothetical protein LEWO105114_11260 [Legionella worsleiensis]|uniref:Uncharacterized protein n=1 Tax=Legionella worsleiensis TaxID=45076 RepID=A0A0W1A952_9GAMM|nr:hypothetical protein Lwor_1739 [Legionella worsleiensis]STY33102.1 Uncharacterised protein [Legionella worsleiensis]